MAKFRISRYRRSRVWRAVGVTHAVKDGGPVLVGESSWRSVNGVFLNTRYGLVLFEFRRIGAA